MNRRNEPRRGHGNKNQGDKPSRAKFVRKEGGKDWSRSSFQKKSDRYSDDRRGNRYSDDRRPRRDDGERRPYGERRDNRRFDDRRDNRRFDDRRGERRDNDRPRRDYDRKPHRKGGLRHVTAEERALSRNEVRLNRFIAHAGVCSRREADKLIADGMVTVNGEVITEMGHKVKPTDDVRYAGERLRSEQPVYLLLNKPKGFITTVEDERARKTVMDLVGNACKERIYPVGRLDRATTGVLLFTNDGDLAKKLTHPSHGAKKIYMVTLDKALKAADLAQLAKGITLEDGDVKVDKIEMLDEDNPTSVGVELHIGRNRIVRRMFEHLGYEVTKLDRTSFAGLTKKNLNRGQYRFLGEKEVGFLKMI